MWAVVLGYLWFMPDLGFPLATFLLLVAFIYLLGETRWHIVLGLALAVDGGDLCGLQDRAERPPAARRPRIPAFK